MDVTGASETSCGVAPSHPRDRCLELHLGDSVAKRSPTLELTIKSAYADILGDLDIATATDKRVRDLFKDAGGVEGSMLARAVRFYIKAAREAAI